MVCWLPAQYLEPEQEARPDTPPEVAATLPAEWPEHGQIVVQDLQLRYRPEMPLVLRGISFTVEASEKVRSRWPGGRASRQCAASYTQHMLQLRPILVWCEALDSVLGTVVF